MLSCADKHSKNSKTQEIIIKPLVAVAIDKNTILPTASGAQRSWLAQL
jgi:hypothetical protein